MYSEIIMCDICGRDIEVLNGECEFIVDNACVCKECYEEYIDNEMKQI